jgi:hypothetical protein
MGEEDEPQARIERKGTGQCSDGRTASFNPNGESIVLLVAVGNVSGYDIARRILMSLHPQPDNIGLPVADHHFADDQTIL